jgi:hypothetical protein
MIRGGTAWGLHGVRDALPPRGPPPVKRAQGSADLDLDRLVALGPAVHRYWKSHEVAAHRPE